jgi:hypothetical protein
MKVVNKTPSILYIALGKRPAGTHGSNITFWTGFLDAGQSMEYAINEKPPASGLTYDYVVEGAVPRWSGGFPRPPDQSGMTIPVDCPGDATVVFSAQMTPNFLLT